MHVKFFLSKFCYDFISIEFMYCEENVFGEWDSQVHKVVLDGES